MESRINTLALFYYGFYDIESLVLPAQPDGLAKCAKEDRMDYPAAYFRGWDFMRGLRKQNKLLNPKDQSLIET
jgi:hypothetical protein